MGACCGTLNVRESAIIETWTDRELRHGPISCYCVMPCINSVSKVVHVEIPLNHFARLEDTKNPSQTKYVYGPMLFKLENPYQQLRNIQPMPILDQNDYLIVTDATGRKRTEVGPMVFRPLYGEVYDNVKEAISIEVNHYIVILDKSSPNSPIRHIRGPVKVYPGPYDEIVPTPDQRLVRPCVRIDDTTAIWLKKVDGQTLLVDEPQFFMPMVGEVVERTVNKTILKESEFCIVITPTGQNLLYMGNNKEQRSFFLPPFYKFHQFIVANGEIHEKWDTLPRYIPSKFTIRTSDSVQVVLDCRISFSIFEPNLYVKKPIDFWTQIGYWVQNEMLDVYAKFPFREFLRSYADEAKRCCDRAHDFFNEFGIKLIDVQVINYYCADASTQKILDEDIITRVNKQNQLYAREADVNIMEREKAVQLAQMQIDFQRKEKENEILLKRKELEIAVRMKEVDLQIEEEKKRTELMNVKRDNAVKEGEFEGLAQGASVAAFLNKLPEQLSMKEKVGLWNQLRDLERAGMMYTKVQSIHMYPPGSDLRQLQIVMDDGSKKLIDNNPNVVLPAILNYNADDNKGSDLVGSLARNSSSSSSNARK